MIPTTKVVGGFHPQQIPRNNQGFLVMTSLPGGAGLSFLSFIFGPIPTLFPIDAEEEPVWQMPELWIDVWFLVVVYGENCLGTKYYGKNKL